MLRTFQLIDHPIQNLHELVQHLVCEVWCKADENGYENKIHIDFKPIVDAYDWLENEIKDIYEICKNIDNLQAISDAFVINNKIEELCEGQIQPVYLDALPDVVEKRMKPLFVKFYNELLERAKVYHTYGTKKDYFNEIYKKNPYSTCPCCGYHIMKSNRSKGREAFDHYLPKKLYPFASINFLNLIPLCYECNSTYKGETDTIENGRKAFYPFSIDKTEIAISMVLSKGIDFDNLEENDIDISFTSPHQEKVDTWNELFGMSDRYFEKIEQFSFSFLNRLLGRLRKRRKDNPELKFKDILTDTIDDYRNDPFLEFHYLKIPLMNSILSDGILAKSYDEAG
ncbi:hypothetical protein [Aureispira anguillae]|uniref:HNH endonuclease n=1 Tax=Aureispira anguillae TaxID=2864201 RepID=A0A915YJV0_9BACT|nr:hypothetical protein [Aureispira anguillae]BDS14552.1 hypothetical protein AsAng_0053330 [Aureispira anguillae]